MFGLPVYRHFIQGSAIRTWNCVTHIANSIWYKLYPAKPPTMPRSRRRYHSRSRSRSASHDRDRDAKRRKIDGYDDSSESEAIETIENINHEASDATENNGTPASNLKKIDNIIVHNSEVDDEETVKNNEDKIQQPHFDLQNTETPDDDNIDKIAYVREEASESSKSDESAILDITQESTPNITLEESDSGKSDNVKTILTSITPVKPLTPKQLQKRVESEKKKMERQKEREDRDRQKNSEREERERQKNQTNKQKNLEKEEREKKKQQERDEKNQMKIKLRQEKEDQKNKERLEKQKELEQIQKEKEQKRKEKEEVEEQKRLKRQQELDEKNKEKQKVLEQKQKTSAMFVNFFTKKKNESNTASVPEDRKLEEQHNYFMPFELKSDMRLAPAQRRELSADEKKTLEQEFSLQEIQKLYLDDLRVGKPKGKQGKTWPYDEDNIMVVDDIGETIAESHKSKMRAKFLKFDENERPAYYGTWRKRSSVIKPRVPCRMDPKVLNYEVDSDDEWEAEGEGESLKGSDDEEEKEQEPDQDYEVDNEFFVPHCYLSDDEVDDEVNAKLNPEMHKAKLKLLKNEFDAEMKSQTQRLKTIIYGCVWMDKNDNTREKDPMRKHMNSFACVSNEFPIIIPKQTDVLANKGKAIKSKTCPLDEDHLVEFLKCIHGNVNKRRIICRDFLKYLAEVDDVAGCKQSLASLGRQMVEVSQWSKCQEDGVMLNKFCWNVKEEVRDKYGVTLPNKWNSSSKLKE